MFNNLRQFDYERSPEESLGFYLIYTLGLLVVLPVIGALLASLGLLGNTNQEIGILGGVVGCAIGVVYCAGLGVCIMLAKHMVSWHSWLLLLLALVAAVIHGVVGMAIIAYMTTRPREWLMPETVARGAQQRRPAYREPPSPREEESEIVRQYEEVMMKVGRKTVERRRLDLDDDAMQDPKDPKNRK